MDITEQIVTCFFLDAAGDIAEPEEDREAIGSLAYDVMLEAEDRLFTAFGRDAVLAVIL